MNVTNPAHTVAPASSMKMLQAMVGIGIMCALLIVLTYEGTLPRIERLKAEALEKAIFKVLPGITQTTAYQLDQNNSFSTIQEGDSPESVIYAGFDENDQLVGLAVEASEQGYADVLRILYGYDPEQQAIVGFYVLESKETPGLGDKIEKDANFLANFKALDVSLVDDLSALKNRVVPVKSGAKENPWEVDCITGATISSRAIGDALGASTERWVPLIYNNKETFKVQKSEHEKSQQ